eukprot:353565-Chlamydomonas_euryale.AAC.2
MREPVSRCTHARPAVHERACSHMPAQPSTNVPVHTCPPSRPQTCPFTHARPAVHKRARSHMPAQPPTNVPVHTCPPSRPQTCPSHMPAQPSANVPVHTRARAQNSVPGDKSAMTPGGIRIGTPALTTRGFKEADFVKVGDFLHRTVEVRHAARARGGLYGLGGAAHDGF